MYNVIYTSVADSFAGFVYDKLAQILGQVNPDDIQAQNACS